MNHHGERGEARDGEVPEQASGCTFGGPDGKTLYVTARTSLYALPMLVTWHRCALAR